jgi:2-polyprenyl-3-methyl-5-hydroxy-6-metoxy-1,4-benzoquinol methylase
VTVQTDLTNAHCLACKSTHVEFWANAQDVEYCAVPESFTYVRCAECNTLSIVNPPTDRLGEIYPDTYYSFGDQGASLVGQVKEWLDRRAFRKIFAGVKGDKISALDVGGGAGWLLTLAKSVEPRINQTMVVDLDAKAESLAHAAGHDFYLGPVETYETDRRFDVIFMLNLIEHVADPVAVLEKMQGLLAPGGIIFLKTPNHDSLDARLFRTRSWGGLHCPRHWVIFSPESFGQAAQKAGLQVKSLKMTQGAPFWAVSVLEWMGRKGWAKIDRQNPMVRHALFGPLTAALALFDFVRLPFSRTSQMFVTLGAGVRDG